MDFACEVKTTILGLLEILRITWPMQWTRIWDCAAVDNHSEHRRTSLQLDKYHIFLTVQLRQVRSKFQRMSMHYLMSGHLTNNKYFSSSAIYYLDTGQQWQQLLKWITSSIRLSSFSDNRYECDKWKAKCKTAKGRCWGHPLQWPDQQHFFGAESHIGTIWWYWPVYSHAKRKFAGPVGSLMEANNIWEV